MKKAVPVHKIIALILVAALMPVQPPVFAENDPETVKRERARLKQAQRELEELRVRFEKEVTADAAREKRAVPEAEMQIIERTKQVEKKQIADDALTQSLAEIEKTMKDVEKMRIDLQAKQAEIEKNRAEALAEVAQKRKELELIEVKQKAESESLKTERERLAAEIERMKRDNETLVKQREDRLNWLASTTEEVKKSIDREREELEAEKEKAKAQIEAERKAMQTSMELVEKQEKQLKEQMAQKQEEFARRVEDIDRQMQEVKAERAAFEADREARMQKMQEVVRKYEELKSRQEPPGKEIVKADTVTISERTDEPIESSLEDDIPLPSPASRSFSPKPEYFIDYGDVLEVNVWKVDELTKEVLVRPDGMISFPLVGEVHASGRSLTQLDQELTHRLSEYVRNPQVSIGVKQFGGRRFIILGEVKIPGVYRFTQNITLVEAIALAGGFVKYARSSKVLLIRGDINKDPKVTVIHANTDKMLKKGMLAENLAIMPYDTIYVTRGFIGNLNDFLNDFVRPAVNTAIDFMVLRSAIRVADAKRT